MARGTLINSLRFFEAVARQGSMTGAATELGVTPGAVSHHVRQLTEHMGEQLLVRHGRGVALTQVGQRLAERLTAAFGEVENSVRDAVGAETPTVRLAMCSSIGPGFLIPRLSSFYDRYPEIELKLLLYARQPELTDVMGDAFISTQKEHPGFWSRLMLREILVAVRAPGVQAARMGAHLLPLITTDIEDTTLGEDWRDFWAQTNQPADGQNGHRWLMCSHYLFAMEMAKQGLGIALVPEFLAARDLAMGVLTLHSPARVPSGRNYYLCIKTSRVRERGLSKLSQWFADDLLHSEQHSGGSIHHLSPQH